MRIAKSLMVLLLSTSYTKTILVKLDILKSPQNQLVYLYSDYHNFTKPEILLSQLKSFVAALASREQEESADLAVLVEEIASFYSTHLKDPCLTNKLAQEIKSQALVTTSYENIEVRKVSILGLLIFNPESTLVGSNAALESYTFEALFEEMEKAKRICCSLGPNYEKNGLQIDYYSQELDTLLIQNNLNRSDSMVEVSKNLQYRDQNNQRAAFYNLIATIGACFFDTWLQHKIETQAAPKIVVIAGSAHVSEIKQRLLRNKYTLLHEHGVRGITFQIPEPITIGSNEFKIDFSNRTCNIV